MIGPAALEPATVRMEETFAREFVPDYYARTLKEIARSYPETRDEVVRRLTAFLDRARDHDPSINGFVVGYLIDLLAVEAWPVIEKAFSSGDVDETIVGSADYVKHDLGLGPPPAHPYRNPYANSVYRTAAGGPSPYTARARAEKRVKKQKTAKRRKKRSR
jgi:hypothetical protein